MRYLSVCSGIEAATVAWHPLGWRPWAFSEIEPFPTAVLAHHYPTVPNLGDMTKFKDWPDATLDLLCGGTPCQSFSAAGLRAGLDDPRGQLMLTFGAIAARYRPRWLVWENVPGVLSSSGGRDFGAFLGLLGFLGYGFAYRVLDAQFVRVDGYGRAVPQRRQRVFVVGCLGDWRSAAAVLLERESLRGDSAPRRSAGTRVTTCLDAGPDIGGDGSRVSRLVTAADAAGALAGNGPGAGWRIGPDEAAAGQLIPLQDVSQPAAQGGHGCGIGKAGDPMYTLQASTVHGIAHTLRGEGFDASEDGTGRGTPLVPAVAFNWQGGGTQTTLGYDPEAGTTGALHVGQTPAVSTSAAVRRLMPVECERLQGFPDGYTAIPWRGKPASECPDGPRYKALGNSWAVNCARWIGWRISLVEQIHAARRDAA